MKSARSIIACLCIIPIALSSTSVKAEVIGEADQLITFNTPTIQKVGKGAKRKNLFGNIPGAKFILRSSPIESEAVVHIYRDNENYDILTCATPCLFEIPINMPISFNVMTPSGYSSITKAMPIRWGLKDLQEVIKPDDITFHFIKN